jgi:glucose-1-phosphate cytidylyltransferase
VTAVAPTARFGALDLEGAVVRGFREKPMADNQLINGGFFVLQPSVIDLIEGDATTWEAEPMERLARTGQLMAYRHDGFWQPMDTLREKRQLEELWASGNAPWQVP